jgi:hypothetical protein
MEKTGDETVDSMFDEIVETKIGEGGKPEVVTLAPDDEEIANAAIEMVKSWNEFKDINKDGSIAAWGYAWWKALSYLSLAEDRLKQAFLGRDRSPASIKQYHRFRLRVIWNKPYRADA